MTLRVESCDLEQWQRSATEAGLSVSEWMRRTCNAGNGENSGMRRDESVPLEKRSTRRNGGRVGAIENIAHETLRNGVNGGFSATENHRVDTERVSTPRKDKEPADGPERASAVIPPKERDMAAHSKVESPYGKTCPHGIAKGWRCTLCGGIVP